MSASPNHRHRVRRRRRHGSAEPFVCRHCGGPCRTYKGSVHGWTCTRCLNRHLLDDLPRPIATDQEHQ